MARFINAVIRALWSAGCAVAMVRIIVAVVLALVGIVSVLALFVVVLIIPFSGDPAVAVMGGSARYRIFCVLLFGASAAFSIRFAFRLIRSGLRQIRASTDAARPVLIAAWDQMMSSRTVEQMLTAWERKQYGRRNSALASLQEAGTRGTDALLSVLNRTVRQKCHARLWERRQARLNNLLTVVGQTGSPRVVEQLMNLLFVEPGCHFGAVRWKALETLAALGRSRRDIGNAARELCALAPLVERFREARLTDLSDAIGDLEKTGNPWVIPLLVPLVCSTDAGKEDKNWRPVWATRAIRAILEGSAASVPLETLRMCACLHDFTLTTWRAFLGSYDTYEYAEREPWEFSCQDIRSLAQAEMARRCPAPDV